MWVLFSLQGRMQRSDYAGWQIGVPLAYAAWLFGIIGLHQPTVIMVGGLAGLLVVLTASICTTVQRLHDMGQSGWWITLVWLAQATALGTQGTLMAWPAALVALGITLSLFVWPGDWGSNRYGWGED